MNVETPTYYNWYFREEHSKNKLIDGFFTFELLNDISEEQQEKINLLESEITDLINNSEEIKEILSNV